MVTWAESKKAYAAKHAKKLKIHLHRKAAKAAFNPLKDLLSFKKPKRQERESRSDKKARRLARRKEKGMCPNKRPKYTCKKGTKTTGCTPKGQYRPCKR